MKPSSFVALICSLAINGFNSCYQPAVAEQFPPARSIAEATKSARLGTSDPDNLVVTQIGEKNGYKDDRGQMAIAPRFDNILQTAKYWTSRSRS